MTAEPQALKPADAVAQDWVERTPPRIQPYLRLMRQVHPDKGGSAGLAAQLRAQALGHPLAAPSLPLDLGVPTPIIPPHLRRAVALRDRHCRFPGCEQPPSVCQVHHLIPRAREGPTALSNLALLCRFHHLIVIHRWGWTLACRTDGTTTAANTVAQIGNKTIDGAAIAPGGAKVALRTYTDALEWDVKNGDVLVDL